MHASMIFAPLFAALALGAAVTKPLDTDYAKMPGSGKGLAAAIASANGAHTVAVASAISSHKAKATTTTKKVAVAKATTTKKPAAKATTTKA